jgi:transcriptional regulator with XRE-family HTH domain
MFELSTPKEILKELALRAKNERIRQDKTQEDMAKKAGIGLATYQRFESNGQIKFESFVSILFVLGRSQELSNILKGPVFSPKNLFGETEKNRERASRSIDTKKEHKNTKAHTRTFFTKIMGDIKGKDEN